MLRTSRAARTRARRMRRRLMVGSSLLLVFLVVAAPAGYGYVHYRFGQIRSVDVPGLHEAGGGRPFNLLVVGSDSRESLDAKDGRRFGDVGGAALSNLLLVASASRESLAAKDGRRFGDVGGQRNDTTLVIRVEPAR